MTASKRQKFEERPGISESGPLHEKRQPLGAGSAFTAGVFSGTGLSRFGVTGVGVAEVPDLGVSPVFFIRG